MSKSLQTLRSLAVLPAHGVPVEVSEAIVDEKLVVVALVHVTDVVLIPDTAEKVDMEWLVSVDDVPVETESVDVLDKDLFDQDSRRRAR
jgi:hypothetical protein